MSGVVVCDLDGVVYRGSDAVDGAADALRRIDTLGHRLIFCTNNSTRTPADTASKIAQVTGYPAKPDQVVSSALAAARLVSGRHRAAYVLGGNGIVEALEGEGIAVTEDWIEADLVVVGLDVGITYLRLADALRAIHAGARFVATNRDPTFPAPEGLRPGAGAIVAALETAAGVEPEVAGKPHAPMRRLLAERIGSTERVWMVGDRPDTDLAMGVAEGWTTVLVLSGVTSSNDTDITPAPDLVVERLTDLPELL